MYRRRKEREEAIKKINKEADVSLQRARETGARLIFILLSSINRRRLAAAFSSLSFAAAAPEDTNFGFSDLLADSASLLLLYFYYFITFSCFFIIYLPSINPYKPL